jgi:aurora kinase
MFAITNILKYTGLQNSPDKLEPTKELDRDSDKKQIKSIKDIKDIKDIDENFDFADIDSNVCNNSDKRIFNPSDRFKCFKKVGSGTFGTVFLCRDEQEKKNVVIKKIKMCESKIKSHKREYVISRKYNHPNLIKGLEAFYNKSFFCYVFEWFKSITLREYIQTMDRSNPIQTEQLTKNVMKQLCSATFFLYKKNIVHRDIKPENILIDVAATISPAKIETRQIKLIDFGFANSCKNVDKDGFLIGNHCCGTFMYIAPEILLNKKCHIMSDHWSMGILMYELLYGVMPYNPETVLDLQKILTDKFSITYPIQYSDECMDFIGLLLNYNVSERAWTNIINHDWLR